MEVILIFAKKNPIIFGSPGKTDGTKLNRSILIRFNNLTIFLSSTEFLKGMVDAICQALTRQISRDNVFTQADPNDIILRISIKVF